MSQLDLSHFIDYLRFGSTAIIMIINMFTLTARGSTLEVRIGRLQTSDSDF